MTATTGQGTSAPAADRSGRTALVVAGAAWAVVLVLLLRHRTIITSDSLSNYLHVWWIAKRLWHGYGLPFRMPVLGHGQALAYPYAFIPWTFAALLWPLLGEWSVGVCFALGWAGMVAGTFHAFPELKRGWWAAATLLSPALIAGILLGQLPFLWAASMLLFAIGRWRAGRHGWAIVLAALAQLTHPAVLLPLVAATVLVALRLDAEHRRLLVRGWVISVIAALPAVVLVFASPVTEETSPLISAWIEVETVGLRSLFLLVPAGLVLLRRRYAGNDRPARWAVVGLLVFQLLIAPFRSFQIGWQALFELPHASSEALARSPIEGGKVYRVLAEGDHKWAPYLVVRAGGTLDSELFPESLHWRSFRDEAAYARFLQHRQVDVVLIQRRYRRYGTNEQALLDELSRTGRCIGGVAVQARERTPDYAAYTVTRGCKA